MQPMPSMLSDAQLRATLPDDPATQELLRRYEALDDWRPEINKLEAEGLTAVKEIDDLLHADDTKRALLVAVSDALDYLHILMPGKTYTPAEVLTEHFPQFLHELETLKEKLNASL